MKRVDPKVTATWSGAEHQSLHVSFLLAAGEPRDLEKLREVVGAFIRTGSRCGFARATPPLLSSRVGSVSEHFASPEQIRFDLKTRRLDRGALHVLRNLAVSLNADVIPINELMIEDRTPNERAAVLELHEITWDDSDELYPPLSSEVSFAISTEDPADYRRGRRCQIDLREGAGEEAIEQLTRYVRDWATLVEYAGFSPPIRAASDACITVDTLAPFDDIAVEVFFSVFDATEECWRVLFNVLEQFSQSMSAVTRVTLT